jgi:hypothetical protein
MTKSRGPRLGFSIDTWRRWINKARRARKKRRAKDAKDAKHEEEVRATAWGVGQDRGGTSGRRGRKMSEIH